MGYFITNLSFNFLVKEFLKSANVWQSYSKTVDCVILPIALHFCPRRCITRQINKIPCVLRTETAPNHCHVNRLINVSLLSTNIKLQYTSFDLLTDRLMPSVTDRLLIMYVILLRHFLLQQLCTVGHWIFYLADVNIFLLVN